MRVQDPDPSLLRALDELEAETALADARLADDGDDLALPIDRALERRFEPFDLAAAADEAAEPGGASCCTRAASPTT